MLIVKGAALPYGTKEKGGGIHQEHVQETPMTHRRKPRQRNSQDERFLAVRGLVSS